MSRSLEARLERLERAAQRQPDETVDIFIIGVEPDGTEVEGDPPLVFRIPAIRPPRGEPPAATQSAAAAM
ncbi:MAG: hypothetical protein ACP5RV_12775 [Thiomonas sp.]